MFQDFRVIGPLVVFVFVVGMLGACDSKQEPPQVSKINVDPSTIILVGEAASLTIQASGIDLQFEWAAARGTLSSDTAPSVLYTAPDSPGPDTVTVKVIGKGGSTVQSITFQVSIPTPTSTPTPTYTLAPTPTPVPSATPSPAPTTTSASTPTPSPSPSATPTTTPPPAPPPLLEIFPQSKDAEAFYWEDKGGELTHHFVESDECRHSGVYGLQIEYKMSGEGNGGWGVHWANAPADGFDASGFSTLDFWVKGLSGKKTFQIGLKDSDQREIKIESEELVVVSADEWRLVAIPLSEFANRGVNTASLDNVHFSFRADHGEGTICIDDISFSPSTPMAPHPTLTPICRSDGNGGTETIPVGPQHITRIRIDFERRALTENAGFSLWEVEIYGPDTGNLALDATPLASSSQDGYGCDKCFPKLAIDGKMDTRWSSDFYEPQWLEITFPTSQTVNRIVLKWENAYAKEYCVTLIE
jgi:hypothetical protein